MNVGSTPEGRENAVLARISSREGGWGASLNLRRQTFAMGLACETPPSLRRQGGGARWVNHISCLALTITALRTNTCWLFCLGFCLQAQNKSKEGGRLPGSEVSVPASEQVGGGGAGGGWGLMVELGLGGGACRHSGRGRTPGRRGSRVPARLGSDWVPGHAGLTDPTETQPAQPSLFLTDDAYR